jgi:hypothetical protein
MFVRSISRRLIFSQSKNARAAFGPTSSPLGCAKNHDVMRLEYVAAALIPFVLVGIIFWTGKVPEKKENQGVIIDEDDDDEDKE